MASRKPNASAVKALQKELKDLNEFPMEGFKVMVSEEENLFVWDVAIFGPPMTLYEGGYFKARLCFPDDYPYSPPTMHFLSRMYHPNIYENGEVCISILHSPGDDPQSGELPSERWNPTQNVRTILLSVISLLNEPNIHSAAHVDASVAYRKWKESNGVQDEYERVVTTSYCHGYRQHRVPSSMFLHLDQRKHPNLAHLSNAGYWAVEHSVKILIVQTEVSYVMVNQK
uniref:Ubiquitin-conjugating enzyme E2 R2 n=1 Tax=Schistosoma haematobium TaxID=6185 RepID=A0A094ZS19_SCHHA